MWCDCGHSDVAHGDRAIVACSVPVKPAQGSLRRWVPCPCSGWKPTILVESEGHDHGCRQVPLLQPADVHRQGDEALSAM